MTYNSADELCWYLHTASANDCATTPSGATTYAYTDAAEMASSTGGSLGGLALTYNLLNQTTAIDPPGSDPSVPMSYIGTTQDRRTSAGLTTMSYAKAGLSAQRTGVSVGSPTQQFIRLPDGTLLGQLDTAGATTTTARYYLRDGQDSIMATVGQADNNTIRYLYEPYGQQIRSWTDSSAGSSTTDGSENNSLAAPSSDTNPWRFQSGYQDPTTGTIKYGTRYYLPVLDRWTQVDPHNSQVGVPITWNPYAFTSDNPVNHCDPSGRWDWPEFVTGVFETFVDATALVGFGEIALEALGFTLAGLTVAAFFWVLAGAIDIWGVYEIVQSFE